MVALLFSFFLISQFLDALYYYFDQAQRKYQDEDQWMPMNELDVELD